MIKFHSDFPIAYQSDDHKYPWGTRTSNSRSDYFQFKLMRLFSENVDWSLLDLGCSAGGFVEGFHELGVAAFGIEGSDYNRKNARGSWPKLDNIRLFTGDITKKFSFVIGEEELKFDVVTAWDVFEHIEREDLGPLMVNLSKVLRDDGIVVLTIATIPDVIDGIDLHKTQMPRTEWEELFFEYGFSVNVEVQDYLAGHSPRGKRINEKTGFNIVLSKSGSTVRPLVPDVGKFERILDLFIGGRLHGYLRRVLQS